METVLSQQRVALAIATSVVGIVTFWLTKSPLGLLAPMAAMFLFARGRTVLLLHAVSAIGLVGSLLIAALYAGAARELAVAWATFFAVALCIGAIVTINISASHDAGATQADIRSTASDAMPTYPVLGPTLQEKSEPRHSPFVSISAGDDKATAALMVAASFWGGTPYSMRYWQRQPDGSHRWIEVRSEPFREPSGTQLWRGVITDIDDQRPESQLPSRVASSPPSDDDAVRAAKIVESLLGNAWAFDAAGRPTYLTPLSQPFVAVTLEEFQTAVDEGHTFFKCTAHPDDYDRISATWRHSLKTGDPFFIERRVRRASGIHDWTRTAFVPTRDRQGRITGWYGSMMDLDAYRSAELALHDRERELSQLVDMVPTHIRRLTPEGEPTFFNKRLTDFLGLDVVDLDKPGMSRLAAAIETLVHPDDAASMGETVRRSLATGEGYSMKYRMRRADGVYRWMEGRAEPLRDEDGAIVQWYVISIDIDDEMRAQEALRESERSLRALVETAPARIWCTSPDGEPIYFSRQLREFFGFNVDEKDEPDRPRLSSLLSATNHPDEAEEVISLFKQCLVTGEPYMIRHRQRRFDGEYRWVQTHATPMRDTNGAIVQWNGINFDIHDLVIAQEALRESEQLYRALFHYMPIPVWRTNTSRGASLLHDLRAQGVTDISRYIDEHPNFPQEVMDLFVVEEVNRSAVELFGAKSEAELTGSRNPFWQAGIGTLRRSLEARFRGEQSYAEEIKLTTLDGRVLEGLRTAAFPSALVDLGFGVGSFVDGTDRIRAQEELRLAQEKMARASQAASLAELSASIAHEVNQPLAAVIANSHACQRWLNSDPPNLARAQMTVERIIRDANSAADVVSRIRALFRQSMEPRNSTTISSVVVEARNLMADEAARHRVRIDVDVESDLPLVAFDRVQVQQVLINLIRNGVEAMDAAAGDRILGMRVRRTEDVIQTEISDRGRGVEFPDKIFEPFFTTKEHGMGMGLAICRSIIESHGGRLWVENNEPRGATFVFTLPVEVKMAS